MAVASLFMQLLKSLSLYHKIKTQHYGDLWMFDLTLDAAAAAAAAPADLQKKCFLIALLMMKYFLSTHTYGFGRERETSCLYGERLINCKERRWKITIGTIFLSTLSRRAVCFVILSLSLENEIESHT
jgi:hypothetical protein